MPGQIDLIKEKIIDNPYLGGRHLSGTYIYEEGRYIFEYRILRIQAGEPEIEWLSIKKRLHPVEVIFFVLQKPFRGLGLRHFFRTKAIGVLLLILILLIIFFPSSIRIGLLEGFVGVVTGSDAEYQGNGWLRLAEYRLHPASGNKILLHYYINPFKWTGLVGAEDRPRDNTVALPDDPIFYSGQEAVWLKLSWAEEKRKDYLWVKLVWRKR